jgi:hypothetical protein
MDSISRTDTLLVRNESRRNNSCTLSSRSKSLADSCFPVLYHQPEKMLKSKEDLAERQENLERLKQQHGIE